MLFRDLHRQYEAMKAEMDEAILSATRGGAFIMGPQVAELEDRLADYVGVRHCVSCANGTDALRLALRALGVKAGDAVFVPDFTFFASAEAVALVGATPVFVDVDKSSFNIDPGDLADKFNHILSSSSLRPKAVIAVDLFGLPADYRALRTFCDDRGLFLIEDGAQGFGGRIGSRRACSFGDIATTSFFPAKPLGCYGDGGALFTDNALWADALRSLRLHGKGSDKYDNVRVGINSRLDTIQAAILLVKLRHFDSELLAVNHVASRYSALLGEVVQVPSLPDGFVSSWAQFTIQTPHRDTLRSRLHDAGIPSMVYYPRTMSRQSAFAAISGFQAPCPVADRLASSVLSIPMGPYVSDNDIDNVVSAIRGIVLC